MSWLGWLFIAWFLFQWRQNLEDNQREEERRKAEDARHRRGWQ